MVVIILGDAFSHVWNLDANIIQVLETTWLSLQQRLKEAKDMDGIIAAHDEYLKRIGDKALMTKDTKQLWDLLSHVSGNGLLNRKGLEDVCPR